MDKNLEFYIDDHAVLFGSFAKSADSISGEKGIKASEIAVEIMGKERGLRAAMRCKKNGDDLSMKNYLLYSEWEDYKGWSKYEILSIYPVYNTKVTVCGWNEIWLKYGFEKYGKLYCQFIDKNLVKGFNPKNNLEISSILTEGEDGCNFSWAGCKFENEEEMIEFVNKKNSLLNSVTKDFLYHCAHMYSVFRRICYCELGLEDGNYIMKMAEREYSKIFGCEKLDKIIKESKQDFLEI